MQILVPEGVSARVEIDSELNQEGSQYEDPGSRPQPGIRIDMGAGSLRLVYE